MSDHTHARTLLEDGFARLQEGQVAEGLQMLQQAATLAAGDATLEGRVYTRIAHAYDFLGNLPAAVDATERALAALTHSDDHDTHLLCRYGLGHRLLRLGQVEAARTHVEQAVEMARRLGNRGQLGNALVNLGNCAMADGRLDAAAESYAAALAEFEEINDPAGRAAALVSLGNVRQGLRDWEAARQLYVRALDAGREANRWIACNDARINLARVVYELGDIAGASHWFEQARDEARDNGHVVRQAECAYDLGLMRENLGQTEPAFGAYLEAWEIFSRIGPAEREALVLRTLVNVCRRTERPQRLLVWRRRALKLARLVGDTAGTIEILDNVAIAFAIANDAQHALDYWESALALLRRTPSPPREIPLLENLRRLYERRGRPDLALEHAEALVIAYQAVGDRRAEAWTLHDLGQLLLVCGAPADAFEPLDAAESLALALDDPLLRGLLLGSRANALLALDRVQESLTAYQAAMTMLEPTRHAGAMSVTLANMALAHEAAGEPVRAHACLRDAERLREQAAAAESEAPQAAIRTIDREEAPQR